MIILNINDLLKFCLDSVLNYVGSAVMLLLLGIFLTVMIVNIIEKLGTVIVTTILVFRSASPEDMMKKLEKSRD